MKTILSFCLFLPVFIESVLTCMVLSWAVPLEPTRIYRVDLQSPANQRLMAGLNTAGSPEKIVFAQNLIQEDSFKIDENGREKIIAVIPIKDEVSNGYVFDLLADLTRQTGIEAQDLKLVFAINNSNSEKDENSDSYKKNLELRRIFDYVSNRSSELPEELESWQLKILNEARTKTLNCDYLHINNPPVVGDPIEFARTFALNIVSNEIEKVGRVKDLILTSFDADSRLEPDFFKTVFDSFEEHQADLVSIDFDDITVSGRKELFETSQLSRFRGLRKNVVNSFITSNIDWRAYRAEHYRAHDPVHVTAFRARIFEIGGKRVILPNLKMKAVDRAAATGGDFSQHRLEELKAPNDEHSYIGNPKEYLGDRLQKTVEAGYPFEPSTMALLKADNRRFKEFYENCDDDLKQENLAASDFARFFEELIFFMIQDSEAETQEFRSMLEASISKERTTHNVKRELLQELFKSAYQMNKDLNAEDLDKLFPVGSRRNFYLKQNLWFIELINEVRQASSNPQEAWQNLVTKLPEYLKEFEDTEFSLANAKMLATRNFIAKARSNSAAYPAFNLTQVV